MEEFKRYLMPLYRWWWLLLIATLIALTGSYLAVRGQPKIYQSHATVLVGQMTQNLNPNSNEFYLAQQLASTYADFGNREGVKNATMKALGLSFLPESLVRALPNTALIDIAVTDTDPKRAQLVASEMAKQLIAIGPSASQGNDNSRQQFVNDQLDKLQAQIKDTQSQIGTLQQNLGSTNNASQISDMQNQIAAQQTKLNLLQSNYASLLSTTLQGSINTLSVIEAAGLPTTPIGPNILMTVGLAGAIGLILAALIAYGIESIDDTVKTNDEIIHLLHAPILGSIGEIPEDRNRLSYVMEEPQTPVADEFRMLRTNIDFLGVDKKNKVLIITSLDGSDGKTTIAANLSASIAQADKRVILVESDLRKPNIQNIFPIEVKYGLSDICLGNITIEDGMVAWGNGQLSVITAGSIPPNPVELLSSSNMSKTLEELRRISDQVILDCPPIFLADTLVLAGKSDGVILVVYPGHTQRKAIKKMLEQTSHSAIKIIGIIVNHTSKSNAYYGYKYYKTDTETKIKKSGWHTKLKFMP